jgi:hypothetical protein
LQGNDLRAKNASRTRKCNRATNRVECPAKFDEVENIWHGSARYPQMRGGFDEHAPLSQLLEQFRTIRAEFRFKEDGVNTVVTIERGKK